MDLLKMHQVVIQRKPEIINTQLYQLENALNYIAWSVRTSVIPAIPMGFLNTLSKEVQRNI